MKCGICGDTSDLFAAVTGQPACSLCVVGLGMRTPVLQAAVDDARRAMGLQPGEYRKADRLREAREILGR